MSRATLPTIVLALALVACGDKEEEAASPAEKTAGSTQSGSIRLRGDAPPNPGSELHVTQVLAIENGDVLQRIGEKEITGTMQIIQTEQQTVRFLSGGRREIEIGDGGAELQTQIGELAEIDESHPDPLAGKTVTAKPSGEDKWEYTLKDEPDQKLPEGFSSADVRADALYPEEYLGFGDVWHPKPAAIAALLGPGFQLRDGEIKMRLISIENLGGQRCAVIGVDIKADGLFKSSGSRQDVSIRLKGKIHRSLHLYQDLKADLSGSIELSSKLGNAEVRIKGPVEFRRDASWKH
jgi:hypothetical protein